MTKRFFKQLQDKLFDPKQDKSIIRSLWELGTNLALASLYLRFVLIFGSDFLATHRASILLFLVKACLDVLFFLIRKFPTQLSLSPAAWVAAIGGSFLPLILMPAGDADNPLGQIILASGVFLTILGICSLNRSFGLVPANRGIKTDGLYRIVRHPLYSAHLFAVGGFLLNNFSVYNLLICAVWLTFQVIRILKEETFLAQDPEYRQYMTRTRWRLLPFVF